MSGDLRLVIKAADFAAVKHRKQRRKDPQQTPYINHPIGVAEILMGEGQVTDAVAVAAALLHDTVEDTDTSHQELVDVFGEEVAAVVGECTDDKTKSAKERKAAQVATASSKSLRARQVKLADKLYNLRDLNRATPVGWTPQRVQEYFVWAEAVVAGLRGACPPLEHQLDKLFQGRKQ